ncbi:MAG: MFS transporter [Acidobacteria bacterium]|nr:MFS transporter [Acidobacteriota bacterium]
MSPRSRSGRQQSTGKVNAASAREKSAPPLAFIYSITVAGILANTTLTPALPDVLDSFDQPNSAAGLIVAAGPLPGIVLAPVIGVLADRLGRRRVLLPCLVIFGVGSLLVAFAPTFELLLLARLAQGIGSAGLINLAVVLIGDNWEGPERTRLIGRNAAVLTFCLAVVPSISGLITEFSSWRFAVSLGAFSIPVAIAGARFLDDSRPGTVHPLSEQLRGAWVRIRNPVIMTTIIVGFLVFVVIFGVFLTALPLHLEEEFGLSAGARGLILSAPAVGAVAASLNLSRLRRHLSLRAVLVIGSSAIALAALIIGLAPTLVIVVIGGLFYGLGEGTSVPSLQVVAVSATPDEHRATVMASWVGAVRLGQAVGPLGAAALLSATSEPVVMFVGAALFGVAALMLALGRSTMLR